tara:strand:- start:512 stop:940 length:429 start_codon:yes stop_codon:yes gene_type:complete
LKIIPYFLLFFTVLHSQSEAPADYWMKLIQGEKVAFVNGVYGGIARMKLHHEREVQKQYMKDPYWIQPYYINRFYDIVDEHISQDVTYDLNIVAGHIDALYANYDNRNIPLIEAIRIVSVAQDGEPQKADLILLRAQKKYNP